MGADAEGIGPFRVVYIKLRDVIPIWFADYVHNGVVFDADR
jgi:hypothetical protein